ncbi:MAG: hypothetical protein WDN26_13465 [Chitinophagaceae bacterium]
MRKSRCFLAVGLLAILCTLTASAQTIKLTGTVRNGTSKEAIPSVSVVVKG